jgi:hypothetical protein
MVIEAPRFRTFKGMTSLTVLPILRYKYNMERKMKSTEERKLALINQIH